MPETQQNQKIQEDESKKGRSSSPPFPRNALKQCVELAESIEKNNAGQPFDRLDLAKSLNWSPNSSGFRTLIISSGRYGITEGGYAADKIALTKLGSSIVAPTADDNPKQSLRQALMTPDVFKKIYEKFNKKNIPREDVFRSTLKKEFGIEPSDVDSCYKVIMQNIEDYGLAQDFKDNKFLNLDKLGESIESPTVEYAQSTDTLLEEGLPSTQPPKQIEEKQLPKQIFVAHGKNTKPLEQLEKILNKFKVNYKVAVEEAHSGRPISTKVAELMKNSTSGIFIFTADEKTTDNEGNEVWRPSDNVVYELGAASALYGNKIVIFKESDVKFASDFSDLGYISFDKDKLDAKAADLMIELINLGFMQLTPT